MRPRPRGAAGSDYGWIYGQVEKGGKGAVVRSRCTGYEGGSPVTRTSNSGEVTGKGPENREEKGKK